MFFSDKKLQREVAELKAELAVLKEMIHPYALVDWPLSPYPGCKTKSSVTRIDRTLTLLLDYLKVNVVTNKEETVIEKKGGPEKCC